MPLPGSKPYKERYNSRANRLTGLLGDCNANPTGFIRVHAKDLKPLVKFFIFGHQELIDDLKIMRNEAFRERTLKAHGKIDAYTHVLEYLEKLKVWFERTD